MRWITTFSILVVVVNSIGAQESPRDKIKEKVQERVKEKVAERLGDGKRGGEEKSTDGTDNARNANGKVVRKAGTVDSKMTVGDKTRTYRLHTPKSVVGSPNVVPLVIVLHGAAADGLVTEVLTGMDEVAQKNRFLVAYPNGNARIWDAFSPPRPADKPLAKKNGDVEFLLALIEKLVANEEVDPRRVYMTGISNGAYMTNRFAGEHPEKVAAIGAVAGTIADGLDDRLNPATPVPLIYFHGTEDKLVGLDGTDFLSKRPFSRSTKELCAWWANRNQCETEPKSEAIADKSKDGMTVTRFRYASKNSAKNNSSSAAPEVIYYEIKNGGHTWPGGNFQPEALLGKTCRDINASELMWEFFSQYERSAANPN